MKNDKSLGRTYLSLGGRFFLHYIYFDLNVRDGDKYRAIFCRIRKKDKAAFEEALEEIRTKMSLLGHNDYDGYCVKTLAEIDEA